MAIIENDSNGDVDTDGNASDQGETGVEHVDVTIGLNRTDASDAGEQIKLIAFNRLKLDLVRNPRRP